MRYTEFGVRPLTESKGIFGRLAGDKFVHGDGREYSIIEVVAFPDPATQSYQTQSERDDVIAQFEQENNLKIEWVNAPASNMLAFGVALLSDFDGNKVAWGKYLRATKHDMLGTWGNKQVPAGWNLATKGAQKLQAGYDPQNLIKSEAVFSGTDAVIKTVAANSPDSVRTTFTEALKDLAQGNANVVFHGLHEQIPAIRDYFGEIMQPIALMGGVVGGQAEDARKLLADGAAWRDCKVFWPMAMNAQLCDSYLIAPNGVEIGISSKGGSGANASAKNLHDAYVKAQQENNTALLESAEFTIEVVKIITEHSAKEGPIKLCEYLGLPGFNQELQAEIEENINNGVNTLDNISKQAQSVIAPYNVKLTTVGFNAGYALLSAVAKTAAAAVNKNPEFSKGASALLNQSSIMQIYTTLGKQGNDAVLKDFRAVYPPNFEGTIMLDGGKNYYSSRIGGKMAFYFK
jgi:hypothetical protein